MGNRCSIQQSEEINCWLEQSPENRLYRPFRYFWATLYSPKIPPFPRKLANACGPLMHSSGAVTTAFVSKKILIDLSHEVAISNWVLDIWNFVSPPPPPHSCSEIVCIGRGCRWLPSRLFRSNVVPCRKHSLHVVSRELEVLGYFWRGRLKR